MKDSDIKTDETERKDETDDIDAVATAAAATAAVTAAAAVAAGADAAESVEPAESEVKAEVEADHVTADTVPSVETPIFEGTPAPLDSITAEATPAPETPVGEAGNTVEDSTIAATNITTTSAAPITANVTPVPETTKKSKSEKKDTIDLEDFGESKKSLFNMYKRVNDIIFSTLIRQQGFIKNPKKVNTEIEDFRPSSSEFIDDLFSTI
ncbi:unnamed protein product [[Candida] boidinii]|uniref:Unnamed protein product n=1 Tax=Candida boidinii TaxID=5477 RepID=A0ACB5TUS5_CANBO|nr:unnamed protein product [[Candida] boidinii]